MSIDVIAALGDDALQNLFDLIIPPFPGQLDPVGTNFRVTNIEIPETGVNTYEIHWKTQMMTKPSGKINMPNELTFDFRVDKNWRVYTGFKNWKNLVANTRLGVMAADITDGGASPLRIPITVISSDSAGIPTGGKWLFEGCFMQNLGSIPFDYTAGEPITVSVTLGYTVLNDLF